MQYVYVLEIIAPDIRQIILFAMKIVMRLAFDCVCGFSLSNVYCWINININK